MISGSGAREGASFGETNRSHRLGASFCENEPNGRQINLAKRSQLAARRFWQTKAKRDVSVLAERSEPTPRRRCPVRLRSLRRLIEGLGVRGEGLERIGGDIEHVPATIEAKLRPRRS